MAKKNIELVLLEVKLERPKLAIAPGYTGLRPGDTVVIQYGNAPSDGKLHKVLRSVTVYKEDAIYPFILEAAGVKEPSKLPRIVQKVQYTDIRFADKEEGATDG